jgi:hypothetical protein
MLKLSRSDGLIACWSISWEAALISYLNTAGDPAMETTALALQVLDASGADIMELGVPYSDPIADGPCHPGMFSTKLIPELWIACPSLALMSLPFLCVPYAVEPVLAEQGLIIIMG